MIFMSLIQVGEVLMPQKYMSKAYRNNTLYTKRHPKIAKSLDLTKLKREITQS